VEMNGNNPESPECIEDFLRWPFLGPERALDFSPLGIVFSMKQGELGGRLANAAAQQTENS